MNNGSINLTLYSIKILIEETYSKYFIYQIICIKKKEKPWELLEYFLLRFRNKIRNNEKYKLIINEIFKFIKVNMNEDLNILFFYENLFKIIPNFYFYLFLYVRNIIERLLNYDFYNFNGKNNINVNKIILIKSNIKIIDIILRKIIGKNYKNIYDILKEEDTIFKKKETIYYHYFISFLIKNFKYIVNINSTNEISRPIKKNKPNYQENKDLNTLFMESLKNNIANRINNKEKILYKFDICESYKQVFDFYEKYFFSLINDLKTKFEKDITYDFKGIEINFKSKQIFNSYKKLKNLNLNNQESIYKECYNIWNDLFNNTNFGYKFLN